MAVALAAVCTYEKDQLPSDPSLVPADAALVLERSLYREHEPLPIDVIAILDARPGATGCNPVGVELTFSPTAEFWQIQKRKLGSSLQAGIAIAGRHVRDVQIRLAKTRYSLGETFPAGQPTPGGTVLTEVRRVPYLGHGTTHTFSIHRWVASKLPIVVRFKANWSTFRNVGSCFVHVPKLISGIAPYLFSDAFERRGSLGPGPGIAKDDVASASVVFGQNSGVVDLDHTTPKPKPFLLGAGSWTCSGDERRTTGLDLFGCEASAAVQSNAWTTSRSVGLFILGILAALAAQILYDATRLAHERGLWTRRRLVAMLAIVAYVALVGWATPFEPHYDKTLVLRWATALIASGFVGYFIQSRWPVVVPPLVQAFYVPYTVWFSFAARQGFEPDPEPAALLLMSMSLGMVLAWSIGTLLRVRHLMRAADRSRDRSVR